MLKRDTILADKENVLVKGTAATATEKVQLCVRKTLWADSYGFRRQELLASEIKQMSTSQTHLKQSGKCLAIPFCI